MVYGLCCVAIIFFSYLDISSALGFEQQRPVIIANLNGLARLIVDGSAARYAEPLLYSLDICPATIII